MFSRIKSIIYMQQNIKTLTDNYKQLSIEYDKLNQHISNLNLLLQQYSPTTLTTLEIETINNRIFALENTFGVLNRWLQKGIVDPALRLDMVQ